MDLQKIGAFLAQLRKETGLTQAQLGEKLGVSNKTVSRWETGTYLPPVECLQLLSRLYGITINELLSGCRLTGQAYAEKAEENICATLRTSAFTLKERQDYFGEKWDREHRLQQLLEFVLLLLVLLVFIWVAQPGPLGTSAVTLLAIARVVHWSNRKKAYIESRAFDGTGPDRPAEGNL